jgi:hypothetical protein
MCLGECAVRKRPAHAFHLPNEKTEIVNRGETEGEDLPSSEEMMQIGSIEVLAGFAVALGIDRDERFSMDTGVEIDAAVGREDRSIAREPGG